MNVRIRNWERFDNAQALKVDGVHWSLADDCFVVVRAGRIVLRTQSKVEADEIFRATEATEAGEAE